MKVPLRRSLLHCHLCLGLFSAAAIAQKPELVVGTGHSDVVYSAAFSPDGRNLASASGDDTIKIWEIASGRELRTLHGHTDVVSSVSFSPDGRTLASGSDDNSVKLWDAATGRELRSLTGHTSSVQTVAFSPDGLALASGSSDKTIKLWDVGSGRELRSLTGHTGYVEAVAFGSGGRTLASAGSDGMVKTWNVATGRDLAAFRVVTLDPGSIAFLRFGFSPDGRTLGFSGAGINTITLWDVASGRVVQALTQKPGAFTPPGNTDITSLAFSPDGRTLASGSESREITLWDLPSGRELRTLISHASYLHGVAFSPDGRILASGSGQAEGGNGALTLWNLANGREFRNLTGHTVVINSVAFSPLQRTLVFGGSDNTIKLWDLASGRELGQLAGHAGLVDTVAFSPDGRTLASGSFDKTIKLWDMATGREARTLAGHAGVVSKVAFSHDGRKLASASEQIAPEYGSDEDKADTKAIAEVGSDQQNLEKLKQEIAKMEAAGADTSGARRQMGGLEQDLAACRQFLASAREARESKIEIWNVATGQRLRSLTGDQFLSVGFSRDGRTLASGSLNGTITLWDPTSGTELRRLTGHKNSVYSVNFSPDGRTLASTSYDQTIKLWEVASGRELGTLAGHTASISSSVFSPDGLTLATGSDDGTVKLWNLAARRELRTLVGPSIITSLDFSPDGRFLASGAADGGVRIWDPAGGKEVASLFSFDNGDWAVSDPEGRFDSNNIEEIAGLSWVFPDEPLRGLPPEIFMRDYYETKLLSKLLGGEKVREVGSLSGLNRAQPEVSLLRADPEAGRESVSITVRVSGTSSKVQKDAAGKFRESGAFDLRLFRDRQLVARWPAVPTATERSPMATGSQKELESWQKLHEINLVENECTHTFRHIRLPRRAGVDKVQFTAYAFNSDRVKSLTTPPLDYSLPKTSNPLPAGVPRRAYLISMGVNANQSRWNLDFAVASAEDTARLLRGKLAGEYEVVNISLFSTLAPDSPRVMLQQASKANLKAVLDLLAGRAIDRALRNAVDPDRRIQPATPDDAVVVFISSHGYADPQGMFYVVPYDTGAGLGVTEDSLTRCLVHREDRSPACRKADAFLKHTISSQDFTDWWTGVDAGEMDMILDSCHSAAVPGREFRPGPLGDAGFGQLSYDKGMRILSATQPDKTARATLVQQLGHSLLVEALAREAKSRPQESLAQWLHDTEGRVPILTRELYPELNDADLQLPELFDFAVEERHRTRPSAADISR